MSAPPDYRELIQLREENETLREELHYLRELLSPPASFPPEWRLTDSEGRILAALLSASPRIVAHHRLIAMLYPIEEPGDAKKTIGVFVYNLRQKLAPYGLRGAIRSQSRVGYRMPERDRNRILSLQATDERRAA
jgi:DNA-binding response OmpR family regulator